MKKPAPAPGPAQLEKEAVSGIIQLVEAGNAARHSGLMTPRNRRDNMGDAGMGRRSTIKFRTPAKRYQLKPPSHGAERTPFGDLGQHLSNNQ